MFCVRRNEEFHLTFKIRIPNVIVISIVFLLLVLEIDVKVTSRSHKKTSKFYKYFNIIINT